MGGDERLCYKKTDIMTCLGVLPAGVSQTRHHENSIISHNLRGYSSTAPSSSSRSS